MFVHRYMRQMRQVRARQLKRRLGLTLGACVLAGTALFIVFRVQAGIAVWMPPTLTQVSTGGGHSCGIADGRAYCWGANSNGQLGDNSTTQRTTPVAVNTSGVLSGKIIKSISTGSSHTCVVASDNQVYCWGDNFYGQLGDNSTTSSSVPVAVSTSGVLSGKTIKLISAGYRYTCIIASDDNAYCWGQNTTGQLGNNSTTSSSVPVAVSTSGVLAGKVISSISAGYDYACAIASDSQAYCWGNNTYGQLGNNSTTDSSVPVAVSTSGVLAGKTILSISAAGTSHTCAVASDNQAYCWGNNTYGQLGNNSTTDSSVPVAVSTSGVLAGKTILSISAGRYHTCAVASDNQAYCWGAGGYGRLGNNSTTSSSVPVAIFTSGVLSGKTITSISASYFHTCAIASDNQAYCWGYNSSGQLGNNSTSDSLVPVAVNTSGILAGKAILSISSIFYHTCAIASDNQTYCWGNNADSQLGDGTAVGRLTPTMGYVVNFLSTISALPSSTNSYLLQYAVRTGGVGTCAAQATGFAAVTTSTPIAFNVNAGATHGATISKTANDPLDNSKTTALTYISAAGTFTNPTTIDAGTMGMWDFSLRDNSAPYNTSYCLRIAYSDGTALADGQALPEVTTTTGTLSVGFTDYMGQSLTNPTTTFGNIAMKGDAQTATGTLGTSDQRLRVFNDLATNGWSASIAATAGPTTLWDRADHLAKYDFNDSAGAVDGGDSDTLGGRLTLFPNNATISSSSGCSTSGLSLGSSAGFNEGSVNSITLFTANSTATMGCFYDLLGTGLSQAVPAGQLPGTYTLDMTITVVAL